MSKPTKPNESKQRLTFSIKQLKDLLRKDVIRPIAAELDTIHSKIIFMTAHFDEFQSWMKNHKRLGFWIKCIAVLIGLSIANQIVHHIYFH